MIAIIFGTIGVLFLGAITIAPIAAVIVIASDRKLYKEIEKFVREKAEKNEPLTLAETLLLKHKAGKIRNAATRQNAYELMRSN